MRVRVWDEGKGMGRGTGAWVRRRVRVWGEELGAWVRRWVWVWGEKWGRRVLRVQGREN